MNLQVAVAGILRGVEAGFFADAMAASFEAGLEAIEITMNTAGAEEMVRKNRGAVPAGRLLGIGTVCGLAEAERAVGAGAMFLVTPNTDRLVIEYARSMGIPVAAGALTPTEVHTAWAAGAAMVKVFPCRAVGGPRYIADLRGPFDRIPLMAVGGVTIANLEDYFRAGADAVGVSAALFGREALENEDAVKLGENVRQFVAHCRGLADRGIPGRNHNKGEGNVQTGNKGH